MTLALLAALAVPTLAIEPVLDARFALSEWPLGTKVDVRPGLRAPLWNRDGSVLFGDTWVRLEAPVLLTPSFARVGPTVTFAPIAIFECSAHFAASPYFGTFTSLVSWDDPDVVYDDDELDRQAEDGRRGAGWLTRRGADATLQAKAGPVIVALSGAAAWWSLHASDPVDGAYFYEPEYDILLARDDRTLTADAVVLYDHPLDTDRTRWIYAGALATHVEAEGSGDSALRVGPLGVYNVQGGRWAVMTLVQAYLRHRVYTDPFPPYVAAQVKYALP